MAIAMTLSRILLSSEKVPFHLLFNKTCFQILKKLLRYEGTGYINALSKFYMIPGDLL